MQGAIKRQSSTKNLIAFPRRVLKVLNCCFTVVTFLNNYQMVLLCCIGWFMHLTPWEKPKNTLACRSCVFPLYVSLATCLVYGSQKPCTEEHLFFLIIALVRKNFQIKLIRCSYFISSFIENCSLYNICLRLTAISPCQKTLLIMED